MTAPMQDAILLTWGLLHNIEFGSGTPTIGSLPDAATPRQANLPSDADWKVAQGRAGAIFGVRPRQT